METGVKLVRQIQRAALARDEASAAEPKKEIARRLNELAKDTLFQKMPDEERAWLATTNFRDRITYDPQFQEALRETGGSELVLKAWDAGVGVADVETLLANAIFHEDPTAAEYAIANGAKLTMDLLCDAGREKIHKLAPVLFTDKENTRELIDLAVKHNLGGVAVTLAQLPAKFIPEDCNKDAYKRTSRGRGRKFKNKEKINGNI